MEFYAKREAIWNVFRGDEEFCRHRAIFEQTFAQLKTCDFDSQEEECEKLFREAQSAQACIDQRIKSLIESDPTIAANFKAMLEEHYLQIRRRIVP
jgi:hypothetical protein